MMTLDDLKTNRDTQITVGCIAFFLIAFPLYFSFAASGVSSVAGTRGVGDYQINGNLTYVQLTDGIEYIADGDTLMIDDLHTDSIDDAEDMNIVGVRVVMSYGEDEEAQGILWPRSIKGKMLQTPFLARRCMQVSTVLPMDKTTVEVANMKSLSNGSTHRWSVQKFRVFLNPKSSVKSTRWVQVLAHTRLKLAFLLKQEMPQAACSRSDNGEEVTFSVELIVFDYTIAPVFNEAEL